MQLPREYGTWKGVYSRLRNGAIDGTWERVFTALLVQADTEGDLDWVVAVDSTIVRAHQHAAGAREEGPRQARQPTTPSAVLAAEVSRDGVISLINGGEDARSTVRSVVSARS